MTTEDRDYVAALIRAQTDHFDDRLNLQDRDTREVRDIAIDVRGRVVSLETSRSGFISAIGLMALAFLGAALAWAFSFIHAGQPK